MKRLFAMLVCFLAVSAMTSTAMAAADIGLKGIGVRVGVVDPDNLDTTVGFGILMDLGTFHPNVSFETYANYWSNSFDVGLAESSFRDIAIGAKARYLINTARPTIHPFVGAGASVHMLHTEASTPEMDMGGIIIPAFNVDASDTKFGMDVGGGLRAGVADRIDIIGEAWYTFVTDFNQLTATGGLVFKF
jgi:opacity protein-like surface antigen